MIQRRSEQMPAAPEDDEDAEEAPRFVSTDRNFFCSELVMKAFKACEIIRPNPRSSKNYMPCHLTEER